MIVVFWDGKPKFSFSGKSQKDSKNQKKNLFPWFYTFFWIFKIFLGIFNISRDCRKSRGFFGIGIPQFLVKISWDLKSPGSGFFRGIRNSHEKATSAYTYPLNSIQTYGMQPEWITVQGVVITRRAFRVLAFIKVIPAPIFSAWCYKTPSAKMTVCRNRTIWKIFECLVL